MKSLIKLLLTISIVVFTSCTKTDILEPNSVNKELLLIQNKLGLTAVEHEIKSSKIDHNFIENEKYINKITGELYTIYQSNINPNEKIIKKEQKNKTTKLIKINSDLDQNLNGIIHYKNLLNNSSVDLTYLKGHPQVDKHSLYQKVNFCQANANESISECVDREIDEFCSDIVSTVAYYTNPSIQVLIIVLCSCEVVK